MSHLLGTKQVSSMLLCIGCFSTAFWAQVDSVSVQFRVLAPGLSPDSSVYLAGSPSAWGIWRPDGVRLGYVGDGVWAGQVNMAYPQTFEYKFTLGLWSHEALDSEGFPWENQTASVAENLLIEAQIDDWLAGGDPPRRIQGQVTGQVDRIENWEWPGLQRRDVHVWVPPGYTEQPEMFCDVLFMHDGQNVFDPVTSNFGVDWGVDETLDSLIRLGHLHPTLLVTADCTDHRSTEYAPGPGGEAYLDWVTKGLLPWLARNYRVHEGPLHTTVAGASMGGLISFMLAERHPEAFGAAICMSPAFVYNGLDYPEVVGSRPWPTEAGYFYIDNGGVGLEEVLQPGVDRMRSVLTDLGLDSTDFSVQQFPEGHHFEADWGARFGDAIQETSSALDRRRMNNH